MSLSDLPTWISWAGHGVVEMAAPATFSGVSSYMFVVEGDAAAMQATVDRLLGPAARGVRHTAPSRFFLVTCMDMKKCTSAVAPPIGWLPGREFALWIPLLQHRPGALLPRPVLWAPYIFIDYTIGMVTGREVWGWPKALGRIEMPAPGAAAAARFGCRTTIFETLSAETEGRPNAPLVTVSGTRPLPRPEVHFPDGRRAVEELLSRLLGEGVAEVIDLLHWSPSADTVVLKQFRDSERQDRACYQSLVSSPVSFSNFGGMGLLEDRFTMEVLTCESHRIVADLTGRAPDAGATQLPVAHALWAAFDFAALPGPALP